MPTVTMPQLGESVSEGTILTWYKQPGDPVALDDDLCEIETEKVTDALPSPFEGVMGEILVQEGETVAVGAPLCEVTEEPEAAPRQPGEMRVPPASADRPAEWEGGPIPHRQRPLTPAARRAQEQGGHQAAPQREPAAPAAASQAGERRTGPDDRSRYYSPVVARLAREHGIDLSQIDGTGVGGRITRQDVMRHLEGQPQPDAATAAATDEPSAPPAVEPREPERTADATETAQPAETPAPAPEEAAAGDGYTVVPISATRRTIGERLSRSNVEAPQAWTMVEADVTGMARRREADRERLSREDGGDITLLPYFTASVVEALREHPQLNARWEEDELRQYHAFNVGVAVAAETGLVVPVIHDAGDLSVEGLAHRIGDLAGRARSRRLRREDVEGGTITVNNTGAFGSIASKPIVNAPEVAIVTMERAVKRPVVIDDAIAIRWMMNVCLSFDHRALDGHEAGAFLQTLKSRLEAWEAQ